MPVIHSPVPALRRAGLVFGLLAAWAVAWASVSAAAPAPEVEVVTGHVGTTDWLVYELVGFEPGDVLTAFAERADGSLDPFLAVVPEQTSLQAMAREALEASTAPLAPGEDGRTRVRDVVRRYTRAVDDDSGGGYSALLEIELPEGGEGLSLVIGGTPVWQTQGNFRLWIARNGRGLEPGVHEATGRRLVELDLESSERGRHVQVVEDSLGPGRPQAFFTIGEIEAGDVLYVRAEALTGDLDPVVRLEDSGGKFIQFARAKTDTRAAVFAYPSPEVERRMRIVVTACCEGKPASSGKFRLTVGLNAAEVVGGEAQPTGAAVLEEPTPVQVGVRLEQITGVDQKSENFGAVASLMMRWHDERLAFSPEECDCRYRLFNPDLDFPAYVRERSTQWPLFALGNQQGRRDPQVKAVYLTADGDALYFEKFTATFQAPLFDFQNFPFDHQTFYIDVQSVMSVDYFQFEPLESFSDIGSLLGEEEWIIEDWSVGITEEARSTSVTTSIFRLEFMAHRETNYYIFRIFLPVLIILLVSWFTFFLRDYAKRVDVAAGNLLLFIAFNFTVSGELPHLGYLTLLDSILVASFVVTSLVVFVNVVQRRMEVDGKGELLQRIDPVFVWAYPIIYLVAMLAMVMLFGGNASGG